MPFKPHPGPEDYPERMADSGDPQRIEEVQREQADNLRAGVGDELFFYLERRVKMIDRKYKILAVNPCSGRIHTENDSILFSARDRIVPEMLGFYYERCARAGCDESHIKSIWLLIERVNKFQEENGSKIPDTNTQCEVERCIAGKV